MWDRASVAHWQLVRGRVPLLPREDGVLCVTGGLEKGAATPPGVLCVARDDDIASQGIHGLHQYQVAAPHSNRASATRQRARLRVLPGDSPCPPAPAQQADRSSRVRPSRCRC